MAATLRKESVTFSLFTSGHHTNGWGDIELRVLHWQGKQSPYPGLDFTQAFQIHCFPHRKDFQEETSGEVKTGFIWKYLGRCGKG